MVASSKLLIAALCLAQTSGKKEERKLRGETRKLQVAPSQFEFSDTPGYDDYFVEKPVVGTAAMGGDDDYFKNKGSTGSILDMFDGGDTSATSGSDTGGKLVVSGPKSGKFAKVGEMISAKNAKDAKNSKKEGPGGRSPGPKTGKVGKSAKAAPKIMKVSKHGKDSKQEARGVFYSKSSKAGGSGGEYEYTSSEEVEFQTGKSTFIGGASMTTGSGEYAGLFYKGSGDQAAGSTESDDYFNTDGRAEVIEGRAFNGGYSGTNQGKSAQYGTGNSGHAPTTSFDDDFWADDEVIVFIPRPTVTVSGQAFSVNPQTILAPIVPDGSGNTLTIGTEYLFNELTTNAQNINSQLNPIQVDNEQVSFFVALDGYCDRIGPADQNSVQGYCFFTYTLVDPATRLKSGSFTAQGIIVNAQVPGQLTITGGTGVLTGATGLVEILPASVDSAVNPPLLIQPPEGADPFNGVAGWAHFFEFDVDVLFFLPELYAGTR